MLYLKLKRKKKKQGSVKWRTSNTPRGGEDIVSKKSDEVSEAQVKTLP